MNTLRKSLRLLSVMLIVSVTALVTSCSEEDALNSTDQQTVTSEASTDSYFEEAEDLSSAVAFASNADINNHGGRVAGLDDRLECATLTLSEGATTSAGTITVDFGEGCTRGNITRKGKIIITYEGERRTVNSMHTITFDGFYVNGVHIEGTRTVEVSEITNTYITHEITLTGGKITWPDGSSATREAHHYRKWTHGGDLVRLNDTISILADGTAAGTNRGEVEYSMQITENIVFKAECFAQKRFLPASGEKVLLIGGNSGKEITVNYGTGDCDNVISVTINGQTKVVTVSRG
jgi:hypothetical protein